MNSVKQPIITKSGQTFEFFDNLNEAIATLDAKMEGGVFSGTTLLIEYEDGTHCIREREGSVSEGNYKKTGIKTLLLNSEKGVVQIYGNCHIEDYDTGKEYSSEKDTSDRVYIARGENNYVYPAKREKKSVKQEREL